MLMSGPQKTKSRNQGQMGFTLIELAVVLLILGTLLGGLLGSISQVSENTRRTTARNQLERIEEALSGYAQAYGRLPCPATSTSDGREDRVGGADSNCTSVHGFVPNATLNLYGRINDDGLMLDPWANPYRYSVSPNGANSFTSSSGLQSAYDAGSISSSDMLTVCSDSVPCAGTELSDVVPAIIFSMGADWASTTSATELENAGEGGTLDGVYPIANDTSFIDAEFSEDVYDDLLLWVSPYVIYSQLIQAGQLP